MHFHVNSQITFVRSFISAADVMSYWEYLSDISVLAAFEPDMDCSVKL
jgi:hypothetical protein